jgi:hypothetical protein
MGAGYCLYSPANRGGARRAKQSVPERHYRFHGDECDCDSNLPAAERQVSVLLVHLHGFESIAFNYNGAQITLTQRANHGLSSTIGFTFAHALDQQTGERAGPNGTPGNFKADYASSDFDIRKRFTSTATYALPGKTSFGQMLRDGS